MKFKSIIICCLKIINSLQRSEINVFEDHRRIIHHHNIISAAIVEQSMIFIGSYKYGTANQKLGAFFDEEDGNTTKFTVYPLILQPGVVNPPQLKNMPIVAIDFKSPVQVFKTARKQGIYVVDSKAIVFRVLTFYPGQEDFYAIMTYIPKNSKNSKTRPITKEIATTIFPVSFMFPNMLYADDGRPVPPRTVSANPRANTDDMHEWTVFKSRTSKDIRAQIDTKKGKHMFSVKSRISPHVMNQLYSQLPPQFPFRDTVVIRRVSVMNERTARHDECPRFIQESNVTDIMTLSGLFGTDFARTPVGTRVAHLNQAIASDARMVMYSSVRILYDIVNFEVEVKELHYPPPYRYYFITLYYISRYFFE